MANQADLAAAEGEVPVEVGPMMDSFAEDPPRHWRPSWSDRKLPGATHCLGKPEKDDQFFSWDQSLVVDKNKEPRVREATSTPTWWRSRHSPSCTDWS